jgi:DNA-binding MarR family transcriptional regulator
MRVLLAGRECGTRGVLFQQTVGQILGLNATDMKCLDVIVRRGPSSPTRLAELTGLTTGAVTVLIDRLENAGVIERRPDATDRRRTLLVPTQQAMKKIPPYYESMGKAMEELASGYSPDELAVIEGYFNRTSEVFARETEKLKRRIPPKSR